MRHSAPGDVGPPRTRRDDSTPLRTGTDAIAFLVIIVGVIVALMLVTDWDVIYVGATASCLGSVGAGVSYLIREARRSKSGGHQQRPGPAIDWLALRHAEVRVQGSPVRYAAFFEGTLTPPTGSMNAQEQKIARALALLARRRPQCPHWTPRRRLHRAAPKAALPTSSRFLGSGSEGGRLAGGGAPTISA